MTPTGQAGQLARKLEQDGKLHIHRAALAREARQKITRIGRAKWN